MIILDTHIWVNWILLGESGLTQPITAAINSQSLMAVSAISCFEVSLLVKQRKLECHCLLANGWLKRSQRLGSIACRLPARFRACPSRFRTYTKTPRIASLLPPPSLMMPCWPVSIPFFRRTRNLLGA